MEGKSWYYWFVSRFFLRAYCKASSIAYPAWKPAGRMFQRKGRGIVPTAFLKKSLPVSDLSFALAFGVPLCKSIHCHHQNKAQQRQPNRKHHLAIKPSRKHIYLLERHLFPVPVQESGQRLLPRPDLA